MLGERPPLPNKHRRRWSWSKNNGHSDAGARLTPDPRCTGRAEQTGVGSGCCWGARRGVQVSHSDSRNARPRVVSQGLAGTGLATPSRHPASPGGQHRKLGQGAQVCPGAGKAGLQSAADRWAAALLADSGLLDPSTGRGWAALSVMLQLRLRARPQWEARPARPAPDLPSGSNTPLGDRGPLFPTPPPPRPEQSSSKAALEGAQPWRTASFP